MTYLTANTTLNALPTVDEHKIDALLNEALASFKHKIIVLDDDPTGIQTVHGVSVFTQFDEQTIETAFRDEQQMFFLLTNSRAMTATETTILHTNIATAIVNVSEKLQQPYIIISRGDSTLRGHYPLETETLRQTIEANSSLHFDGEIIAPYFLEGGRLTIEDIHYVKQGDQLVPAGETEFANDRTFGYKASHLFKYINEKTNGATSVSDCHSISLNQTRALAIDDITAVFMDSTNFSKIILNAVANSDIKVASIGIITALNAGKNFLFRTAAAVPKILGGISDKPLLQKSDLVDSHSKNGGLIVVGSHVKTSTEQLEALLTYDKIISIPFKSDLVFNDVAFHEEVQRVQLLINTHLAAGETVVVFTSRKRLDLGDNQAENELALSVKIAKAVTSFVENLTIQPKFIIGKGGITSSEIGTKGLAVKRALVAGQIAPGIPVWLTDKTAKFPLMPYVIFPGNVGNKETLKEIVERLD
ncbi:four-carbon acid sugar kinase family protein [Brochothrix thermosphacta]|uniref:four-carbon acid sugar kinase family protein n=1 Tax=Brochothrix thermosphacta TaxID=2756 RepID=UPI00083FC8C9|nr:four-carbon acid sugar kinase family protein [Brochothrix thermosphacta]ODJ62611.1 hydroxyacid dehydrogenase [Brochothrix thermosphacta]